MQQHQPRLPSLLFRCGLTLLVLTPFADAAQAQSKLSEESRSLARNIARRQGLPRSS
jgi:hypothetical protein